MRRHEPIQQRGVIGAVICPDPGIQNVVGQHPRHHDDAVLPANRSGDATIGSHAAHSQSGNQEGSGAVTPDAYTTVDEVERGSTPDPQLVHGNAIKPITRD